MSDVGNLLGRPRSYYNIDGVGELGIGFMMLAFSLLLWLQLHTPKASVWNSMYTFFLYLAAMVSIIHYGSKAIKSRITYPRTGFVDYRSREHWIAGVLGALVSVLFSVGLFLAIRHHWQISAAAAFAGLLLAASYIRIAMTVRWKWAVFIVLIAGVAAIAALPPDLTETLANHTKLTPAVPARAVGSLWLTFVLYGAVLTISGAISFWRYLRHTQPPTQEDR
jgi:hypothetical protein